MKYAIVESGGKQYKAVEGEPIEVDRLPVNAGDKVGLDRVLMLVDGEEFTVGTPTVDGIQVSTTVMDHIKGPKIIVFKYSPKNRIRVKSGHRQQYTRLMVDAIDAGSKTTRTKKAEAPAEKDAEAKAEKKEEKREASATSSPKRKKPAAKEKKAEKAPSKKTEKAPATSSSKGKKTTTKKTTTKKSSSTKKTEK
ncbi:MAG: 50S ribosomal protein L21 [Anaerolineales bacterium]